jgi:hypothetical protein
MPRQNQQSQRKCWCFTLNPTWEELVNIQNELQGEDVIFAKVGQEVGQSGTIHLQGFVHLSKGIRL